jgi:hypothetical protein
MTVTVGRSTVLIPFACLLMVPAAGSDNLKLKSSTSTNGVRDYAYSSDMALGDGAAPPLVLTDAVTNSTNQELVLSLKGGGKGVVSAATKGLAGVTPRALTMVRSSYRLAREADTALEGTQNGHEFGGSASRWLESDATAKAFPGGPLEAKLIDGGPKGTFLVHCVCAASGSRAKGYVLSYTVENLTDRPLRFKWAGLEGQVGPKRDFLKVERPVELTAETSGVATLDFGEKQEYAIRANFWARLK